MLEAVAPSRPAGRNVLVQRSDVGGSRGSRRPRGFIAAHQGRPEQQLEVLLASADSERGTR
eukprot:13994661-Alexandrium_andersonii.AAC.1